METDPHAPLPDDRLTGPGAVLLLSSYELGHQPLSLASPAGFLSRAGYRPRLIDLSVEALDPEPVRAARFIGVSTPMHTALRLGLRAAARVRAINPGAHLCFFGHYAFLNRGMLLEDLADSVLAGECEEPLLRLVRSLERDLFEGKHIPGDRLPGGVDPEPPTSLAGVSFPGRPSSPFLERLDFAAPAREGLPPLERYARLAVDGERRLAGSVEASRGCRHVCRHCPIPPVYGGRFFVVPREVVLADVRRLVALGAEHVTFADPDFLNGPGHAMAVARAVHAEFPHVTFDVTVKVEHILRRRALLPELRDLGCLFLVSAFESLNDRVLANLAKGHTAADCRLALEIVAGAGIALRPTWVAFTPWTTLEDYKEMLDFIEAHDLIDGVDPVQYAIRLLVPRGSALLELPAMRSCLGPFDESTLSYRWTAVDPRMDALAPGVAGLVAAYVAGRDGVPDGSVEANEPGHVAGADDRALFRRVRSLVDGESRGRTARGALVQEIDPTLLPPRTSAGWGFRRARGGAAAAIARTTAERSAPLVRGKPWTFPPPPRRRAPRLTEPWYC